MLSVHKNCFDVRITYNLHKIIDILLTVSSFLLKYFFRHICKNAQSLEKNFPFIHQKLSLQTSWGFPISVHFCTL